MNEVTVNTSQGKLTATEDGDVIAVKLSQASRVEGELHIAGSEWAKLGAIGEHVDPEHHRLMEFVREVAEMEHGDWPVMMNAVQKAKEIIEGSASETACNCPQSVRDAMPNEGKDLVGGTWLPHSELRYGAHHSVGCPRYSVAR